MTTHRPNNPCRCGSQHYERGFDWSTDEMTPMWECINCGEQTPRITRKRKTNKLKAIEAAIQIREEWSDTDEALRELVDAGAIKSGALFVYTSTFNWHLEQLSSRDRISKWELRYHTKKAREDLQKARETVNHHHTTGATA